jgi:hypothetical protein
MEVYLYESVVVLETLVQLTPAQSILVPRMTELVTQICLLSMSWSIRGLDGSVDSTVLRLVLLFFPLSSCTASYSREPHNKLYCDRKHLLSYDHDLILSSKLFLSQFFVLEGNYEPPNGMIGLAYSLDRPRCRQSPKELRLLKR